MIKFSFGYILALAFAALPADAVSQSFTVDPPAQTRTGLIRLRGAGFGTDRDYKLVIGNRRVHVAYWADDLIECYVPEGAPLGATMVQLLPANETAVRKPMANKMQILPRESLAGRFKWRVKLSGQFVPTQPAVGPDGTIYTYTSFGHLYAVSPSGTIKWIVSPIGGVGGSLSVLPNGNIVVGGGGGVQALSPVDGSLIWNFPLNTPLLAGPTVGPDGNIYAADDSRWSQDVIGAFILNPSGQMIWHGGKFYRRGGGWTPQDVKFSGGNAYLWSDYSSVSDPDVLGGLNAIRIGGGLRWRVTDGVGIMPGAGPVGGVSLFRPSNIEQRDANGNVQWSQNLGQFTGQPQDQAIVASDGRTYFRTSTSKYHVISPTGQVLYSKTIGGVLSNITVSPDANTVALQYQPNYGIPAQIQGYNKAGSFLWSAELPVEYGMTIVNYQHMAFDQTGTTLYFGTAGPYTAAYEAHCYLYGLNSL